MVRYDDYKDSGINWIGEIPAEWRESRIGNIYDARNEKVSELDYAPLSVTMNGIVPQLETAAKTQDQDSRKLVKAGDFAINSRSDRRGSCGIAPCDGSVSLITNVLRPRRNVKMFDEYFEWLFHSEGFADEYYKNGTGIVDDLWSTNWSRMKKIAIPIPPIENQKAISSYLNNRVGFTDSLIEKTTSSIDLLHEYRQSIITEAVTHGLDPDAPMKPSGIEWMGNIPANWQARRVKAVVQRLNVGVVIEPSKYFDDNGTVPFLRGVNIKADGFDLSDLRYITTQSNALLKKSIVHTGDIVVVRDGAPGTALVIPPQLDGANCVSLLELTCASNIKPTYLRYALAANCSQAQFAFLSNGTAIKHLNASELGMIFVTVPLLSEQDEIIAYLDAKTAEIDALIASKERQVELLREYRKSIISEAVTGKFKVPGLE